MILPSISIQRTHHASQWRKWLNLETINLGIFELRAIFVKRYHAAHVAWEMPPKCIDTCWIRMTFFRKRAIQLLHKEAGSHPNKVMNHIHQGREACCVNETSLYLFYKLFYLAIIAACPARDSWHSLSLKNECFPHEKRIWTRLYSTKSGARMPTWMQLWKSNFCVDLAKCLLWEIL